MNNDLYVIAEDTYVDHIAEKTALYSAVRVLASLIEKLPEDARNTELRKVAASYDAKAKKMAAAWRIPARFLIDRDSALLSELMERELIPLGDFKTSCRQGTPCCELDLNYEDIDNSETPHLPENAGMAEKLEFAVNAVSKLLQNIFGTDVSFMLQVP